MGGGRDCLKCKEETCLRLQAPHEVWMKRLQFSLYSKQRRRQAAIPGLATHSQDNVLYSQTGGHCSGPGTLSPTFCPLPGRGWPRGSTHSQSLPHSISFSSQFTHTWVGVQGWPCLCGITQGAREVLWNQDTCVLLLSYMIMKIYSNWEKHAEDREILAKNKIIKNISRWGIGQGRG